MLAVFQLSLTLLLSLASLTFAAAEGSPLAMATVPLSLFTLYVVDWKRWIRVPSILVSLFGLIAFVLAGLEFFSDREMARLLAGGHLIVYLTWLFLIQEKERRHYWWLCALSILFMAISAVLTSALWFGAALLAYLFLASWTLSVFLLYRSALSVQGDTSLTAGAPDAAQLLRLPNSWNGGARDVHQSLVNGRFAGSSLVISCVALGISTLFFLFIPRVWMTSWSMLDNVATPGQPLTGFTDQVRLGDLGEILESPESVLHLTLLHRSDERELSPKEYRSYLGAEPLFRGAVLETYRSGKWERAAANFDYQIPLRSFPSHGTVIQRYALQPIGSPTIFSYGNVVGATPQYAQGALRRNPSSDELIRTEGGLDSEYKYALLADDQPPDSWFSLQRALGITNRPRSWMADENSSDISASEQFDEYLALLRQTPPELDRVVQLAREKSADVNGLEQKVQAIVAWLSNGNEFGYSLKLNVQNPAIDPIEDFLVNRKEGHCEYFASALALMVRGIGAPTRLVSGFKGGNYDEKNGRFIVQQLHAHTWVEVYLNGQWRIFDPTPGERAVSVAQLEKKSANFKSWWGSVNSGWNVAVRLSRDEQQRLIYTPLNQGAQDTWTSIKEIARGNRAALWRMVKFLTSPQYWFSWQGLLLAVLLGYLIYAVVWVLLRLKRIYRKIRRLIAVRRQSAKDRLRRVAFYERFCAIMKRSGMSQQPAQTAREFVNQHRTALEPRLEQHGMAAWPAEIVDMFYRVRFGEEELEPEEAIDLERRLSELEARLRNGKTAHK